MGKETIEVHPVEDPEIIHPHNAVIRVTKTAMCGGVLDKVNSGAAFGKGIHMNMGQTRMHKYLKPLLAHIEAGRIDPGFLISHHIGIEQEPERYRVWQKKQEGVTKIVIDPWQDTIAQPAG